MDSYEKKYKEAIKRAKEYWETDNDNTLDIKAKGTMEYLFPELKESEGGKNKRISKEITQFVKQNNGWNREWIKKKKKQGEKKELTKIEQSLWSEEDEKIFKILSSILKTYNFLKKCERSIIIYRIHLKIIIK